MDTGHEHRLCTYAEAEAAIRSARDIYVTDCFCRSAARRGETKWEYCGHEIRTCLAFGRPDAERAREYSEVSYREALRLFGDWKRKGLLFRLMADGSHLCFCCPCGCGFFRDEDGNAARDTCEPSAWIQSTDAEACTRCGRCTEVCAYDARKVARGKLTLDPNLCVGCSACTAVCPAAAISMVPRAPVSCNDRSALRPVRP